MNNKDQKLVDRLNKRMSGADTSARDDNNGFGMTYTKLCENDFYKFLSGLNGTITKVLESDEKCCHGIGTPVEYPTEFRLLYANLSEIKLRMEDVLKSDNDVDYSFELEKYKERLRCICN